VQKQYIDKFKRKAANVELSLTNCSFFIISGDNPTGKRDQPIESVCEYQVLTVDRHSCENVHDSET
jgi:hypothetical protein